MRKEQTVAAQEEADATKGYHLIGDAACEAVNKKASYITPVPHGVGPTSIVNEYARSSKRICVKTNRHSKRGGRRHKRLPSNR